jgi:signal transduction histidine kinase
MAQQSPYQFLEVLASCLKRAVDPALEAAEELRMTATDAKAQRMGGIILQQLSQMRRMIDALADLSLLEERRLRSDSADLDLQRVLELAVEECRPLLEAKSQRLIVNLADEPLHIKGDEPRLVQALRSVMENAVKYTPEAGSIEISIAAAGRQGEVLIRDTGCGLTPAQLSNLYEPFALATLADPAQGGLGLSLAITRHLVEIHGGTITINSGGPDQGTEVCVTLPLASGQ